MKFKFVATWIVMGVMIFILLACTQNKYFREIHYNDTIYLEKTRVDTVWVQDTIVRIFSAPDDKKITYISQPAMYDSLETQKILINSISSGIIGCLSDKGQKELFLRDDLEYLPYLLAEFMEYGNSEEVSAYNTYLYITMCTEAIDDRELFMQGRLTIEAINDFINNSGANQFSYEYPEKFIKGGPHTFRDFIWYSPTRVDTLRIQAIAHNDRLALKELEEYYKTKGDETGIAIYYKVMLGYEGNGDLAEKFYRVLEPHFNETPGFRKAVREVLLRAAHCDNDKRAQELCDSLGFSLCDYRLPLPAEMNVKERPKSE